VRHSLYTACLSCSSVFNLGYTLHNGDWCISHAWDYFTFE